MRTWRNLQRPRGLRPSSAPGSAPAEFCNATGRWSSSSSSRITSGGGRAPASRGSIDTRPLGVVQPAVAARGGGGLIVAGALQRGQAVRSAVADESSGLAAAASSDALLTRKMPWCEPIHSCRDLVLEIWQMMLLGRPRPVVKRPKRPSRPQQAAAETHGPQRALGVDVQRPDRVRGLRVGRTEARQPAVAETVDRAVA